MLKRIEVRNLKLGMHLHELCGSWMSHPFWRSSFLIDDPRDIRRIIDSGISEAWIDTAKGRDVEGGEAKKMIDAQIDMALRQSDSDDDGESEAGSVPIADEMRRAAKICAKSKEAVVSMFQHARMGKAIEAENVVPLVEELYRSVVRNPGALISIARLKNADDYTYMHSVAVCALMIALARQLRTSEDDVRAAGLAGLLHDVGKMAIPLEVLNKPSKLSDEEFELVKGHPREGYRMLLQGRDISATALDVCLHHHEKVDGTGYPDGLAADNISLFAKMGAVCDVYDAITSNRPYKNGWNPGEAVRKMAEWSKGHFDLKVFHAFVKSVGIYPVGALVRMRSRRLGVIIDRSDGSLLQPKVKVFYSMKSQARLVPEVLDLMNPRCGDEIAANEDPAKWQFADLEQLWRETAVGA